MSLLSAWVPSTGWGWGVAARCPLPSPSDEGPFSAHGFVSWGMALPIQNGESKADSEKMFVGTPGHCEGVESGHRPVPCSQSPAHCHVSQPRPLLSWAFVQAAAGCGLSALGHLGTTWLWPLLYAPPGDGGVCGRGAAEVWGLHVVLPSLDGATGSGVLPSLPPTGEGSVPFPPHPAALLAGLGGGLVPFFSWCFLEFG